MGIESHRVLEQYPAAGRRRRLADQLEAEHARAGGSGDSGAGLAGETRAPRIERGGPGTFVFDANVARGEVEHAEARAERGRVAGPWGERVFDQPKRKRQGTASGLARVSLRTLYES